MVITPVDCHFEVSQFQQWYFVQRKRKIEMKHIYRHYYFCFQQILWFLKNNWFSSDGWFFEEMCHAVLLHFPPNLKNICRKSIYFCKSGWRILLKTPRLNNTVAIVIYALVFFWKKKKKLSVWIKCNHFLNISGVKWHQNEAIFLCASKTVFLHTECPLGCLTQVSPG